MAKAYCIMSSEALCIMTGMTPIIIKTEEAVKEYNIRKRKGSQSHVFDDNVELKDWPHPTDAVKITVVKDYKETTVQAYTDGSKYEKGLGSGVAVFIEKEIVAEIKHKLDKMSYGSYNETVLSIQDRLNMKISMTLTIAVMVTGHGKTRAYLHRFRILEHATCISKHGDHTTDHLLYHCTLLDTHREVLKQNILKTGNWPASKHKLITKHWEPFITFINSTDFGLL